jgi:hypothetical protein
MTIFLFTTSFAPAVSDTNPDDADIEILIQVTYFTQRFHSIGIV